MPDRDFWADQRVLITGHTGFKGSWLARWLAILGAEVHGLALDPLTDPAMFDVAHVAGVLKSEHRVDLRSIEQTFRSVQHAAPTVVLHLAAQPLVRDSFRAPAATYASNVSGTANLLDAVSVMEPSPKAVVVVTSDKVYRPTVDGTPHSEASPLGGSDPYSSSKAMVEDVVDAFRRLPAIDERRAWEIPVATARAGNVIGGGDWSRERLVPDCIRSFSVSSPVELRYPNAVRPWQHVLDPLAGYLLLAQHLATATTGLLRAVNFGPATSGPGSDRTVAAVARDVARLWGAEESLVVELNRPAPPETGVLRLNSGLAVTKLGWRPRWDASETLHRTVSWYRAHADGADMARFTDEQILGYSNV